MKIGNITLKNNLILAPMAGVTDIAFRALCVENGADFAVTEMISIKALEYRNEKTLELLQTEDVEKIKVVQLFGSEPKVFEKVLKMPNLDKFDIIDINMGCPTPKIVNNGAGSRLMTDIDLARKIIETCVKTTTKPITVKFRSGWDEDSINCIEFAKMCESAGAKAITVHARTREQFYSGKSDWELVKKVKESVNIPVILSGDIIDRESYELAIKTTNCDAVMIGRGALGNPEIFRECRGKTTTLKTIDYVKKHIDILRKYYSDNMIVHYMRKHFLWYMKNYKNSKSAKVEVVKLDTIDEVIKLFEKLEAEK